MIIDVNIYTSIIAPAYLDLGTGSYVAQLIIAAILGGAVTLKIYWTKIMGIFKKKGDKK